MLRGEVFVFYRDINRGVKQLVLWLNSICVHLAERDESIALDDNQVCLVFVQFHVGSLKAWCLT